MTCIEVMGTASRDMAMLGEINAALSNEVQRLAAIPHTKKTTAGNDMHANNPTGNASHDRRVNDDADKSGAR